MDVESLLAGTTPRSVTDSYRLSDTLAPRTLQPRQSERSATDFPSDDPFAISASSGTRTRQRQRQQMEERNFYGQEYLQEEPRQRQVFEEPRPLRQYQPYFSNNQSQMDENQLMWRFILFIVVVFIIGLIAYVLFRSLSF